MNATHALFSGPERRRALVTGGSRGIGAAIAEAFRTAGVAVLTPGHDELDLALPASIDRFVAVHAGEPFDILVNNAGINILADLEQLSTQVWEAMVDVNLTAPLRLIQAVVPEMKKRSFGRIVNVGSMLSLITKERRAAYSATKAGLNGLTRAAAVEFAPFGVLVNAVCPGYVDTDLTRQNNSPEDMDRICETIPIRRIAQTQEIAMVVLFLCSEFNTYLTGQTIVVDGGFTCR